MQLSAATVRGFLCMTVRCVPVSDRWISLVLMIYSKVANRPVAAVPGR